MNNVTLYRAVMVDELDSEEGQSMDWKTTHHEVVVYQVQYMVAGLIGVEKFYSLCFGGKSFELYSP